MKIHGLLLIYQPQWDDRLREITFQLVDNSVITAYENQRQR